MREITARKGKKIMAEITMPKLSDTMTEGVVVRWHKKQGETVNVGDVLAEIETDKATMEMEAFDDGILKEIYAEEGQKVAVGDRIALIEGENGHKAPALDWKPVESKSATITSVAVPPAVALGSSKETAVIPKVSDGGRVKASPLARKTATQMNVALEQLQGSGTGGRIIQEDVLQAARQQELTPPTIPASET